MIHKYFYSQIQIYFIHNIYIHIRIKVLHTAYHMGVIYWATIYCNILILIIKYCKLIENINNLIL
jgi:hypothetical protein